MRACQAGVYITDFWDLTWSQVMLMIKGYEKRQTDHLRQTRMVCYMIYCANAKDPKSIDSFMPIPDDYQEIGDPDDELTALQIQFLIEQTKTKFNQA